MKAGDRSLDLGEFEHDCPLEGGASLYSRLLERRGLWPPPAQVFRIPDENPLFRRFLRHIWIEAHAGLLVCVIWEAPPGMGKSIAMSIAAAFLDDTFRLDQESYIYRAERFLELLQEEDPMRVLIIDEGTATFLFSRYWARTEQKEVTQAIWKFARIRKKILFVAAQNAGALDWIIRDDVSRWKVQIEKRNPVTQVKRCALYHTVRKPIWSKEGGSWGYEAKTDVKYLKCGDMTIPAVPDSFIDSYNEIREGGLVKHLRAMQETERRKGSTKDKATKAAPEAAAEP